MSLRTCCALALLVLVPHLAAQSRSDQVRTAFAREKHLERGINLSLWFAQVKDYSAARSDRFIDGNDIALIARLGFDHVRLCVDPAPLLDPPLGPEGLNTEFLARLDRAVDTILGNNLAIEISLFPKNDYKKQLASREAAIDSAAALWGHLAAHYATRDPERVLFEVLNEPEIESGRRWARMQDRLAAAIRAAAPANTIIACGPNYSNIDDLRSMRPLDDGNVIYTFHFYEPHLFTHQGATWDKPFYRTTHWIPYPPTGDPAPEVLAEAENASERWEILDYWQEHWSAERIRALIAQAQSWARKNGVPVVCNEFGVLRDHADAVSRTNWLNDVRAALEADDIGWTMWDYRSGFGLVWKEDGQPARVDGSVVAALGLRIH